MIHHVTAPLSEPAGADDSLGEAVGRAQLGDSAAFTALYREVQPRLLRYLTGLVAADAEDVASEAWLQISRDLRTFSGTGDEFRGWCASIARHRALDHLRAARRRPSRAGGDDAAHLATLVAQVDVEGGVVDAEATRLALQLIATLPRDQAEAVLLRVVMDLDVAGTARVLGKREGSVRTLSHRGLRRLAQQLSSPTPTPAYDWMGEFQHTFAPGSNAQ